jgi:hypothetical protein
MLRERASGLKRTFAREEELIRRKVCVSLRKTVTFQLAAGSRGLEFITGEWPDIVNPLTTKEQSLAINLFCNYEIFHQGDRTCKTI